jgi:hypothetical protein
MDRRTVRALIALAIVALVPIAGDARLPVAVTTNIDPPHRQRMEGQFDNNCHFSHRLPDDPIVKFGQPGASHSHDFFGNTTTNANSTYSTLREGHTTCNNRTGDTAGYWVPSLYDDGTLVTPAHVKAYYSTRQKEAESIKPFPAGLVMLAGDSKAAGPQSLEIVQWDCYDDKPSAAVPACSTATLRLKVIFPDCWNGQSLDFIDHKSHMAYSSKGVCPAGYPVPMPGLQLNLVYPSYGGSGITLASGPAYTAHGDFFNAWDQKELARLVRECLNEGRPCKEGEPRWAWINSLSRKL